MILLTLLTDLFFYNYTSISTCLFLLSFFYKKQSLICFLICGLIWDFFILHTFGLFFLLIFVLCFFSKAMKGRYLNKKNLISQFTVIHLLYFLFKLLVFHNINGFFIGTIINLVLLVFSNRLLKCDI